MDNLQQLLTQHWLQIETIMGCRIELLLFRLYYRDVPTMWPVVPDRPDVGLVGSNDWDAHPELAELAQLRRQDIQDLFYTRPSSHQLLASRCTTSNHP